MSLLLEELLLKCSLLFVVLNSGLFGLVSSLSKSFGQLILYPLIFLSSDSKWMVSIEALEKGVINDIILFKQLIIFVSEDI